MVTVRGSRFILPYHEPKGGLVIARDDDAAKEWGDLVSRVLVPSTITYEPKINSRIVQGKRTRARARQDSEIAEVGTDIVGESHTQTCERSEERLCTNYTDV